MIVAYRHRITKMFFTGGGGDSAEPFFFSNRSFHQMPDEIYAMILCYDRATDAEIVTALKEQDVMDYQFMNPHKAFMWDSHELKMLSRCMASTELNYFLHTPSMNKTQKVDLYKLVTCHHPTVDNWYTALPDDDATVLQIYGFKLLHRDDILQDLERLHNEPVSG